MVNKSKEEIAELKSKLQPLQRTFKTVVLGERRALEADLAEARRTIATLKHQEREAVNRRGHSDRNARELAEENHPLLVNVGELSARCASLMGKHASGVRKAMLERRQAIAREKQLLAKVARREKIVEDSKAEAIAAREAEAEAEAGLSVAEELQAEAEARADEAIREATSATESAADAALEASDAAYVQAVLKAKLVRAEARMAAQVQKAADGRADSQRGPRSRTMDEWAALDKQAEWKAGQRERLYLTDFLQAHAWRMKDVAAALDELGPPLPQPSTHLCRP